jgi:GntR family transcriptional regulator
MADSPRYWPLYRQVYDFLVKQIAEGAWRPSEALPSEQALAQKLGVSQGTMRKALDALAIDKLIERRQGKGTYVVEQTQELSQFRFFRLASPGGARATPSSAAESVRRRKANAVDAERLHVEPGTPVLEVRRTRLVSGQRVGWERIVASLDLFPDLDRHRPLPNALYALYQREYGVHITKADEELKADLASGEDLRRMDLHAGDPVLQIERIALALNGRRAEWRVSRCDTRHHVYSVQLT